MALFKNNIWCYPLWQIISIHQIRHLLTNLDLQEFYLLRLIQIIFSRSYVTLHLLNFLSNVVFFGEANDRENKLASQEKWQSSTRKSIAKYTPLSEFVFYCISKILHTDNEIWSSEKLKLIHAFEIIEIRKDDTLMENLNGVKGTLFEVYTLQSSYKIKNPEF